MSMKLSQDALTRLGEKVKLPQYRQGDLSGGIVHFGIGNFHRSHQAVYLDDLFNTGSDLDWGIIGAGVLPSDAAMRDKLGAQDWLSTVVEQDDGHLAARITAPMVGYLPVGNAQAIVNTLADPAVRIVSLTITEGGYFIDPASGEFDPDNPAIVADSNDISNAKTVFGMIVAGLVRRRDEGTTPFTVMSCDNIPGNGHVTECAVRGLAGLVDGGLAEWIGDNVAFPNSMVDRITPATGDRERTILNEQFGIEDNWPVFCEPFRQWVMEDKFPAGRPALEKVGVTFVEDVAPYELMKIRILNGGHAAIGYPAALMDIEYVHEAMAEPLIRGFLAKLEREEIIPIVPPVPETDLGAYFAKVEERFSNPRIGDTVARLCLDGSNRQPKFILPSTADRLAAAMEVNGLALVSAFWCRYCAGTSDSGRIIPPNDESAARLKEAALAAKSNPDAFLALSDIFGEVGKSSVFRATFSRMLETVWRDGARTTLTKYLSGTL